MLLKVKSTSGQDKRCMHVAVTKTKPTSSMIHCSHDEMKWLVFKVTFLHCKAILGRGQSGLMGRILLWIMPLVQDRSFDMLTSSPECYNCTTAAPWCSHDEELPGCNVTQSIHLVSDHYRPWTSDDDLYLMVYVAHQRGLIVKLMKDNYQ